MSPKRKKTWVGLAIYAGLWITTGVLGLPQVDRAFDREFAIGSPDAFTSAGRLVRRVPVSRVPYVRVSDPGTQSLPETPFRSRSVGFAIAPFLIVDEVCVAQAPLAAFSGRRLLFWCFGYSRWLPLKEWWVS